MDSKADTHIKRARTELESAEILFEVSGKKDIRDSFEIDEGSTYYSGVISHAYYCIFYCTKAMLLTKNIEAESPEVHKKTLEKFKEIFIDTGLLDAGLLMIYKEMIIRAETLLEIYRAEKKKRGDFTYNTIAQANISPARESLENAKKFLKHTIAYLEKQK